MDNKLGINQTKIVFMLAFFICTLLYNCSLTLAQDIVQRTSNADTVNNEDGTYTLVIYPTPVNMLNENGMYQPYEEVTSVEYDGQQINIIWNDKKLILKPYIISNDNKLNDIPKDTGLEITVDKHKGAYKLSERLKNNPSVSAFGYEIISDEPVDKTNGYTFKVGEQQISFLDEIENGFTVDISSSQIQIGGFSNAKEDLSLSTTIRLTGTNLSDDGYIDSANPSTEYGAYNRLYLQAATSGGTYYEDMMFKFNISSVPTGQHIDNAQLNILLYSTNLISGQITKGSAYYVYAYPSYNISNGEWTEGTGTGLGNSCSGQEFCWNTRPTNSNQYSLTPESEVNFQYNSSVQYYNWTVTNMVQNAYNQNNQNISIWIRAANVSGSGSGGNNLVFYSSEATADSVPYLNITYSAGGAGQNATDSEGDTAIEQGINQSVIGGTAKIYTAQKVYVRYLNGSQSVGTFDKFASYGNQRWMFNYVAGGEFFTNMLNFFNILNVWENQSMTTSQITSAVSSLINTTKI